MTDVNPWPERMKFMGEIIAEAKDGDALVHAALI